MDRAAELNAFLATVERRAFRMASFAVKDSDEALDIVQDAMLALATRYAERPAAEWPPLFHRILQSRIMDWHRRRSGQRRIFGWLGAREDETDPIDSAVANEVSNPEVRARLDGATRHMLDAIDRLPLRQQQAFLLRAWEGLDVRGTAAAMGCSEGSVKTHYSRAVHTLREVLGEDWP